MRNETKLSEWLTTFPSSLWLLLFFLIPTIMIFVFAFKPSDLYGNIGEGWTLKTFYALANPTNLKITWRTIWLGATTTLLCLMLAIPMAYYMSRTTKKMRNLMLLLVVIPFWSSFLIRVYAWKALLHPEGFLRESLISLHIISPDTSLLYHSGTVLLLMVYAYLPFAILPLYAASSKFDFQLFEAVLDLGGTKRIAFFKVFIPGIRKGIMVASLMVLIPALGAYVIPDVVGGTQSEMLGNKIAQRTFVDRNLPEASALSIMLAFIVLIPMGAIALIQSRTTKGALEVRSKQ